MELHFYFSTSLTENEFALLHFRDILQVGVVGKYINLKLISNMRRD